MRWSTLASIERPAESEPGQPGDETGPRYLVARAAGQRVAIPLDETREIIGVRMLTRLPGAPAWVSGLLNLRGSVLTVADLSLRLAGPASEGPVVVTELAERRLGMRVEGVVGVERAVQDEQAVEGARSADGAVRGMATFPDGTALVVDVAALQRAALAEA
jgi:purine-binding chemotaxis protein CheW